MISFYPGPSRIYDDVPEYVKDAYTKGILSMSHRSPEFVELSKKTISLLKDRLNIPKNFTVFFTSSATECWEIIAQSLIIKKSTHVYNGAFGEKWFGYTKRLRPNCQSHKFAIDQLLNPKKLIFKTSEVICITQNETSNGTQVTREVIKSIKENNPKVLIAVDATSSMAGIVLDFKSADIWFASIQKCFGLPSGLGIMVCSPVAIVRIKQISEKKHYNSLTFMNEMMEKWQTPFTPNVLGIYLLKCVLKKMKNISVVDEKIKTRQKKWKRFFKDSVNLQLLTENLLVMSSTVIAVKGNPTLIKKIKRESKASGLLLGEGYGDLRESTFRIANFPALKKKEIAKLMRFLLPYL